MNKQILLTLSASFLIYACGDLKKETSTNEKVEMLTEENNSSSSTLN
ncbi:hypothetical protein [Flammeovirga aprica]|uniref:Uncharacterized protein n=1 Tax=Flammeovirga aprica JL-4 TaxID=694437 RepID=A0A7X9S0S5_9BACT|nr:hypothetical protein [Flammeovirga aprica]NME72300.1 hypothetical protein [Flammeovirga aprica JL-4]